VVGAGSPIGRRQNGSHVFGPEIQILPPELASVDLRTDFDNVFLINFLGNCRAVLGDISQCMDFIPRHNRLLRKPTPDV
jgi:hypothetical protein